MRDLRGALLAVGVWAAALCGVMFPASAIWLGIGLAVAAVIGLWAGKGLVVLVMLCASAVSAVVAVSEPSREAAAAWDGAQIEVRATVTSSATVGSDGRLWFDVRASDIRGGDEDQQITAPLRVGIDPIPGIDLGATVQVRGQGMATDVGERAALVVFGTDAEIIRPAHGVFALAAEARTAFITRAEALPKPGAGLLPGLAVGDTRAVSPELNAAMLASGLSHLTAVSGSNCLLVTAAVFVITTWCGAGRRTRIVVSLLALAGFVVLVTPQPSVIRAAVMAALALLSVFLGRPSAGLAMLSLGIVGILLSDPWLATSPGFALSAAATAALLLLARPLTRGLSRWMPVPVAVAIAVPLAAQLACGPIIALFSAQQSLIGVAANLLAAPAAPLGTAIGLLACLAAPLAPLADLLAAAAWLPSSWIAVTAEVSADLPGATLEVPAGILPALIVAVVSAAIAVIILDPPRLWIHALSWTTVCIAVAAFAARLVLGGPLAALTVPEDWQVAACDVGQGDALVVRSEGAVALIDTGPEPDALSTCLSSLGVSEIDLLVLTRFDLDHAGGVSAVQGKVGSVLHGPAGEPADDALVQELAAGGAQVTQATAGMQGRLGAAQWRVLWPPRSTTAGGNDASVVVDIAGGGMPSALFLGDLSAVPQQRLRASGLMREHYTIVKVAHHGSADQHPPLYQSIRPRAALVSVGADNDYGHPRAETIDPLHALGAAVLRTDERGQILLGMREGELAIWTSKADEAGEVEEQDSKGDGGGAG